MVHAGELSSEPAPLLGQRVVLGGLSSRPELNGQRGVARSFEGGRYAVALEGGESVRVRPSNMSELLSGAFDDAAVTAAEGGDETALLAWLDGGGRVNATHQRGEASGLTLLIWVPPLSTTATSGWSTCCCDVGRRSTCRAAKASEPGVPARSPRLSGASR